jgi:hypothetical protein
VSEAATPSGFDDRDNWALEMQQRYAVPVYREYWNVSAEEVTEVDELGKTEAAARVLDADGGTDKVIRPSTGIRHVAQRFRKLSKNGTQVYDPDFSIRTSTYTDANTEYDKMLNAWRNGGNVPAIYTFGVGDGTSRKQCLQRGFREFYFLDNHRFLKLVDGGHLEPIACHGNGDGSEALYYTVESLRNNGVVEDAISGEVLKSAWADTPTSNDFPTAPGIKTTGQVDLLNFCGGADE